ncbi:MAG: hypothetical protein AAFQ94_22525 [Bacteroidota bacterium]
MQGKALRNIIFISSIILVISSCSKQISKILDSESTPLTIVNPIDKFTENVSFFISNTAAFPLLVESTTYYYIERFNDEYNRWDKIPYQPCKCGTPCIPPASRKIAPGERLFIEWDRAAVTCAFEESITETLSIYQKKGIYRMTFVYYPIVDKKKAGRKEFRYEFKLK